MSEGMQYPPSQDSRVSGPNQLRDGPLRPSSRGSRTRASASESTHALGPPTPSIETSETSSQLFSPLDAHRPDRLPHVTTGDANTPTAPPSLQYRRPSVRLRRMSSTASTNPRVSQRSWASNFPWSSHPPGISEPERALVADQVTARAAQPQSFQPCMPRLTEEGPRPTAAELANPHETSQTAPTILEMGESGAYGNDGPVPERRGRRMLRNASHILRWRQGRQGGDVVPRNMTGQFADGRGEFREELVNLLDVVDPEVSTLSTLTNIQNSLFVPDLGHWVNRRPTYVFYDRCGPPWEDRVLEQAPPQLPLVGEQAPIPVLVGGDGRLEEPPTGEQPQLSPMSERPPALPEGLRRTETHLSITSHLSESRYAVLPHGVQLDEWAPEEKAELNDHVRHMLHSRRSRFKRSLKGFGQYIRRPLGFLVTLYATLITLFGMAWVLFLIGWIYVGDEQVYAIHIIDSVLVALFAVMGDGLAPFRAVDTYHMIFVAHYSRKTWKLRKEKRLPKLKNKNDLPTRRFHISEPLHLGTSIPLRGTESREESRVATQDGMTELPPTTSPTSSGLATQNATSRNDLQGDLNDPDDLEAAKEGDPELSVLSAKQQYRLQHHQKKLARSHTFYQPHETETHYAFPIQYLIAIVCLLDAHSCLQISLGACTWGIDYHVRPFALTTVILCLSIACNITAGILISLGDRKTRKKDVSKLLKRQELTGMAIEHLERTKRKEEEKGRKFEEKRSTMKGIYRWRENRPRPKEADEQKPTEKVSKQKRNKLQKGDTWSNRRKGRKN